jgi:hypothetical protein
MYVIRPPGSHFARKIREPIDTMIEHFGQRVDAPKPSRFGIGYCAMDDTRRGNTSSVATLRAVPQLGLPA